MLYVHCSPDALSHWLSIDLSPACNGTRGRGGVVNELGGVETSTSLVQLEASAGGGVGAGGVKGTLLL